MSSYFNALRTWNLQGGLVVEPHSDIWVNPRKGTKAQAEVKKIQSGKADDFKVSIGKRSMKVDLKKHEHKPKPQTEAERQAGIDMVAREIDRMMGDKPLPKMTEAPETALRAFEQIEAAGSRKKAEKRKLKK